MTPLRPAPLPFIPLTHLLDQGRPAGTTVAFGRDGPFTFEDFSSRVASVGNQLRSRSGRPWLIHCDDTYASAIAFFAVLQQESRAIFLPNRQAGLVARFAEGAAGLLVDGEAAFGLGIPEINPLSAGETLNGTWKRLDRDALAAQFSTSGTTGEAKAVPKLLRHLDDEVAMLESRFGVDLPPDTRVFATVSPQHIYGLLFRVLWPLSAGRPFWKEPVLHPEEFLPVMQAELNTALVTSPALLKSPTLQRGLASLRGRCRAVYSSGGLLDRDSAEAVGSALGFTPWEVLGSTETGGVACRQRAPGTPDESALWEVFPNVNVGTHGPDELMTVASPYVSVGDDLGTTGTMHFVTGDRIRFADPRRFAHLGRADRVVKIGEKRLSLPDMEAALSEHSWVKDAALIVMEIGGTSRVHTAIVLNEKGRAFLASDGRLQTRQQLNDHLLKHWTGTLLPRSWRFVEALPRDAQGKLSWTLLAELFTSREGPATPVRSPTLIETSRSKATFTQRLEVPPNLACLAGHFPGHPIVPGVVQLRWAFDAVHEWLGSSAATTTIEALKFRSVLRPGDQFTLRIEVSSRGDRFTLSLTDGPRVFTTARCIFDEPSVILESRP